GARSRVEPRNAVSLGARYRAFGGGEACRRENRRSREGGGGVWRPWARKPVDSGAGRFADGGARDQRNDQEPRLLDAVRALGAGPSRRRLLHKAEAGGVALHDARVSFQTRKACR